MKCIIKGKNILISRDL